MVKIMVRKLFNNKLFKLIFLIPLLIVPIVLFILPSDFFDEGDSVCLSVMLFNMECYGCGMTRAVMHFIHFDFIKAIAYNKLVILVFPLLFLGWIKIVLFLLGKKILKWF